MAARRNPGREPYINTPVLRPCSRVPLFGFCGNPARGMSRTLFAAFVFYLHYVLFASRVPNLRVVFFVFIYFAYPPTTGGRYAHAHLRLCHGVTLPVVPPWRHALGTMLRFVDTSRSLHSAQHIVRKAWCGCSKSHKARLNMAR